MIDDLRWVQNGRKMVLQASDGHVWSDVPAPVYEALVDIEVYIEGFAESANISISLLKGKNRARRLVNHRAQLCKALRVKGFSYPEIGKALNRHHTSIMHLVKDDMRNKNKARSLEWHKNNG